MGRPQVLDWLTAKEAGERLNIGSGTIRQHIGRGRFPHAKYVGGLWLIPLQDLKPFREWAAKNNKCKSTKLKKQKAAEQVTPTADGGTKPSEAAAE